MSAIRSFVGYILDNKGDKSLMSSLRSLGTANKNWRAVSLVGRFCPEKYIHSFSFYEVIALSLANKVSDTETGNFGYSLRGLAKALGKKKPKAIEDSPHLRMFLSVNNSERLHTLYKATIKQLAAKGVHVNHEDLLWDLILFDKDPEAVKRKWATGFYGG